MKNIIKIKAVIYPLVAVLIVCLLAFLGTRDNHEVNNERPEKSLIHIEASSIRETERADAPLGKVIEYEFTLPEIAHDQKLIFGTCHCNTEVYIDREFIFGAKTSENISKINTPGYIWSVASLYHDDADKTCKVTLVPVYDDYEVDEPDFMIGSLYSVVRAEVKKIFPELAVTVAVMILGCVATLVGIVFLMKMKKGINFIAVGLFAVAVSLWRFNYFDTIGLFSGNRSIFVYYFSLVMLMIIMIPLLEVVKNRFSPRIKIVYDILALSIGVGVIVQLILQIAGITDLRELLIFTHLSIIVSIIFIFICFIWQLIKSVKEKKLNFDTSVFIVLGLGLDMDFYYMAEGYARLIFTLLAISLMVFVEGARFVKKYLEEKERFAEHEITLAHNEAKLAESRFTVMMSQIRSHFIFNILNAISGMCKYDPEKADRTIVNFARFLRSNIDIMQNDELVHFHNALHHIEDYVALEQVRYGDNIQFETDIQIDDFLLPPLVM